MSKQFFVSGIGTEVGKTVVSSALVKYLKADYWKPVQSGDLHFSDSHKIEKWVGDGVQIFPEAYRLNIPASPHYSARMDGVEIRLDDFKLPETENNLVVEGAGGLLVPISEESLIVDLIRQLQIPVVLVVRNYLGSINHTLLSIEALKARNIQIAGLIYSGAPNGESERIIEVFSKIKTLGHLPELEEVNQANIELASTVFENSGL